MTASKKLAHDKVFFHKNAFFNQKNCITIKKGYSSKSLHWYQWISVWKVDDENFLHDNVFMLKKHLLQKQLIFFKDVWIENIFVVNPSPKYFNANI